MHGLRCTNGRYIQPGDKVIKKLHDKRAAKEEAEGKDSDGEGGATGPKISIGRSDDEDQSD